MHRSSLSVKKPSRLGYKFRTVCWRTVGILRNPLRNCPSTDARPHRAFPKIRNSSPNDIRKFLGLNFFLQGSEARPTPSRWFLASSARFRNSLCLPLVSK
jgi:hypothetical protein